MWKYSLNSLKYIAYCLAVRLLRGGDIVDLERHKLKHLNSEMRHKSAVTVTAS